ncbi:Cobyrinic acid ac-diamide synthase (plasmid) [Solidesulfovibrio carbinoliphilus subsp. oakridgensis]|uniref:Cobyrinic acid ac-diamide synthase n=1 Tax=Solidesulfovibrio carbinoliphilus subsp. oakridgensis TaxID=694327 RepID=G7QE95_9BACT|nr:ParA family protein [Solidesulfovibrio carbinoliphilus]EHJ45989.1 Cobyrinic acid ac-diamide synthase [Solidesulfovibrio carbinoliphilus subsp. oakridgensis]
MGIIITIANNKGGVGKTTLTCNLAHALALKGGRALVIDTDSQCNATSLLTGGNISFQNSLYDILTSRDLAPKKAIIESSIKKIDLLPNSSDTAVLEYDLSQNLPENYSILRSRVRDYVKEKYQYVLIDTPPNLGYFSLSSLFAADFCIVPISAGSAYSIEGLLRVLAIIEKIQEDGNPDLRFLRLLVNNIDRRTAMGRVIVSELEKNFKGKMFETHIPRSTVFEQAEYIKSTVFGNHATTYGAKAYRELATELKRILGSPE